MDARAKPSSLKAILLQLCPRCRSGRIFRRSIFLGLAPMHERCPVCGLKYEREPGYFLGAMYISYGLALVALAILGGLLWWLTAWPFERLVTGAVVLLLPLVIPMTLFSRVLFIHLDQQIDPADDEPRVLFRD